MLNNKEYSRKTFLFTLYFERLTNYWSRVFSILLCSNKRCFLQSVCASLCWANILLAVNGTLTVAIDFLRRSATSNHILSVRCNKVNRKPIVSWCKSYIYCDWKKSFERLNDVDAGKFFCRCVVICFKILTCTFIQSYYRT